MSRRLAGLGELFPHPVLSAVHPAGGGLYRAPSWLKDKAAGSILRWRVVALDEGGKTVEETVWRSLKFGNDRR